MLSFNAAFMHDSSKEASNPTEVLHLYVYILVKSCLPFSAMCSVQKFIDMNVLPHRGVRVWHMISVSITAGIYPICSL